MFCLVIASSIPDASADGLTSETLQPTVMVEGRPIGLYIKIDPMVLTDQTRGNASLYLRLFDTYDDQVIKKVAFSLVISKDNSTLIEEIFYSDQGDLTVNVLPHNEMVNVESEKDPITGWWLSKGGKIKVTAPVLLEGGLYKFDVSILRMENKEGNAPDDIVSFERENAPTFVSLLSVGSLGALNYSYGGDLYRSEITSYYEKADDLKFDASGPIFSWSMPFDWNVARIASQNIFVHEEIKISKSFINNLNSSSFAASVNGIYLTRNAIAIDPYTSESETTVHIILPKAALEQLATIRQDPDFQSQNSGPSNPNDRMLFGFFIEPGQFQKHVTSSTMITDTGTLGAAVRWAKVSANDSDSNGRQNILSAASPVTLEITFFDIQTQSQIIGTSPDALGLDVRYDLDLLDSGGVVVVEMKDLVASGGHDQRLVKFPADGEYQIKLKIIGIKKMDGGNWDNSKNGIAFGVVVVPEFSPGNMAGVIWTLIAISLALFIRLHRNRWQITSH